MRHKSIENIFNYLFLLTGTENKVTIGILDIEIEFIPHLMEDQILDIDALNGQVALEKTHNSEKERLFLIYAKQWWKEYLQVNSTKKLSTQ